ncbi:MAG: hypothetical protein ACOYKE_04795 [Ferruginibacter sp.]
MCCKKYWSKRLLNWSLKSSGLGFVLLLAFTCAAQEDSIPTYKGAIQKNKSNLYKNIVNNGIIGNLNQPLSIDTEDQYLSAFWSIALTGYRNKAIDEKIKSCFLQLDKTSANFQKGLIELAYSTYPKQFTAPIKQLFQKTTDAKILALSAEYLLQSNPKAIDRSLLLKRAVALMKTPVDTDVLNQLLVRYPIQPIAKNKIDWTVLNSTQWLPKNAVLMISFQRKNRQYPGLVLVRDTAGKFVQDDSGKIFSVPQLAKSVSNLPGYFSNANTPQGLFRMFGFAVSKSNFIGPTPNIQLTLPVETSIQHFFNDSTITDTIWSVQWYQKCLPEKWRNNVEMYETFMAGKIGRNEIIAHGTTVDPEWYANQPYYPLTPTQGCLCTKEIWSAVNGKRTESDQIKLVNALKKAGGPNGYCLVIEVNDQQKNITLAEILQLLKIKL